MTTISWRLSPAPFRQRVVGGFGETGFADQGGPGGARQGRRARSYAELYGRNRGRRIAPPGTAWRHKTVSPNPPRRVLRNASRRSRVPVDRGGANPEGRRL